MFSYLNKSLLQALVVVMTSMLCLGSGPAQAGEQANIINTKWSGTGRLVIGFSGGGRFVGHDGCNPFYGTFLRKGNSLRIALSGAGTETCPSMESSDTLKLYDSLHLIRSYMATPAVLDLYDGDGKRLLRLTRQIWG